MLEAVIVGSGFSGIGAAIELKRAGIHDFVILEKADRLGGTWRENTYPGAACDIPSHLYSYSFEPNPAWSRTYGRQPEILAYLERCADKYGLRPHFRFGHAATDARFDEPTGTWRVATDQAAFIARALMLGNGALHLPSLPDLPGLATFEGVQFHSARWDHTYELAGRRVAVIGTGASSIQIVPELAPRVGQLHVFQRSAPWVIPKSDREIGPRERWALAHVPGAHRARRTGLYWLMESRVLGFAYAPKLLARAEPLVLRSLHDQVPDPVLRAKLTPTDRLGCKRVLLSNDYYPALQRPNVELVTDRIDAITPRGVRTTDGRERAVDAIVCCTGFRVTEYLSSLQISGRGGQRLDEAWRTTLRNYLGITVSGFPNLFLLMGPNTGLGHNSMIFMIEAQARYATAAIEAMRRDDLKYIDVRPEIERAFRSELRQRMKHTVWATGCRSWYQTPDGEVFLWPAASVDYWRRTRRIDLADYELAALADETRVSARA